MKRVTESQEKHLSGIDTIIWNTPIAKACAVAWLKRRDYKPLPLRQIPVLKKNFQTRHLGIPVMKECSKQALNLLVLKPFAETNTGSGKGALPLIQDNLALSASKTATSPNRCMNHFNHTRRIVT